MCGLYGIYIKNSSALPSTERMRLLVTGLAHNNMNRGRDSFGLWTSSQEVMRQVGMVTKHGPVLQDFLDRVFSREKMIDGFWMGGHTRAATHGSICEENTHPFEHSNIILAHNGVVDVEGYDNKDHAVDSARIAQAIVEHGWVPGIAKVQGSCALITSVHLAEGKTKLYIYRHNQTLWYAVLPWGYVISSTKGHLEDSLEIAGLKADSFAEPPVDKLISPWDDFELAAPAQNKVYTPTTSAKSGSCGQPPLYDGYDDSYVGGCGRGRYAGYRPKDRGVGGSGEWMGSSHADWPKDSPSLPVSSLLYSTDNSGTPIVQFKRWLVNSSSYKKNGQDKDKSRENVVQYCDFCDKRMISTMLALEEVGDDYLYCCYDAQCKKAIKDMRMLFDGYVAGTLKDLPGSITKMFETSYVYDGIIANLLSLDKKFKTVRSNPPKTMNRQEQQALVRGLVQEIASTVTISDSFFPFSSLGVIDQELLGERPNAETRMSLADMRNFNNIVSGAILE